MSVLACKKNTILYVLNTILYVLGLAQECITGCFRVCVKCKFLGAKKVLFTADYFPLLMVYCPINQFRDTSSRD